MSDFEKRAALIRDYLKTAHENVYDDRIQRIAGENAIRDLQVALDRIAEQDAEILRLRTELEECRASLLLAYGAVGAQCGVNSEIAKRIESAALGSAATGEAT